LLLLFEHVKNRTVLYGPKLFQGERSRHMRRARLQHLLRAQQTANMFSAKGSKHGESIPC
jgi:hypothetical protein